MFQEEGPVVINVHCVTRYDDVSGLYVARFPDLGLTARGETEEEAITHCKQLLNKFVRSYRTVGQLEKRLVQSGVEWWWLADYPKSRPEPEYVGLTSYAEVPVGAISRYLQRYSMVYTRQYGKEHSPLAVTA